MTLLFWWMWLFQKKLKCPELLGQWDICPQTWDWDKCKGNSTRYAVLTPSRRLLLTTSRHRKQRAATSEESSSSSIRDSFSLSITDPLPPAQAWCSAHCARHTGAIREAETLETSRWWKRKSVHLLGKLKQDKRKITWTSFDKRNLYEF